MWELTVNVWYLQYKLYTYIDIWPIYINVSDCISNVKMFLYYARAGTDWNAMSNMWYNYSLLCHNLTITRVTVPQWQSMFHLDLNNYCPLQMYATIINLSTKKSNLNLNTQVNGSSRGVELPRGTITNFIF